jgi:hypothetical protein
MMTERGAPRRNFRATRKWINADTKASALEILEGLLREANEQFARYKQELGISD